MKTAMLREVLERGAESSGGREFAIAAKVFEEGGASMDRVADLALFLSSPSGARHHRQVDQRRLGSLGMLAESHYRTGGL